MGAAPTQHWARAVVGVDGKRKTPTNERRFFQISQLEWEQPSSRGACALCFIFHKSLI